jgi:signal transduction histidine kinase
VNNTPYVLAHASLRAGGASLVVEKRPFNIAVVVRRCVEMKHPYLAPGVTISSEIDEDVGNDDNDDDDSAESDYNDDSTDDDGGFTASGRKSRGHRASPSGEGRVVMVIGDPMRIEQVLVNLLNNAIRHTSSGFVKVKVRRAKLSVGGLYTMHLPTAVHVAFVHMLSLPMARKRLVSTLAPET